VAHVAHHFNNENQYINIGCFLRFSKTIFGEAWGKQLAVIQGDSYKLAVALKKLPLYSKPLKLSSDLHVYAGALI